MSYRNAVPGHTRLRRYVWERSRTWLDLLTKETGVTLIELVVAIGLATVVSTAAALTITTILRFTGPVKAQAIASQQVQNAGAWLARDIQMSLVEPGDGNPVLVTLTQPQNSTEALTIVYRKEPMPDGAYRLVREELETGKSMVIAEDIDISIQAGGEGSGLPSYLITVSAQPGTVGVKQVVRYYKATPRLPQD